MTNMPKSPWSSVVATLRPASPAPLNDSDDKFDATLAEITAAAPKAAFRVSKPLIPTHGGYVVVLARTDENDPCLHHVIDDLDLTPTTFRRAVTNLVSRWRNLARLGVCR